MVAIAKSLLVVTLAASSCLASPHALPKQQHQGLEKRLFGLFNLFGSDSTTTTSTTSTSSTSSVRSTTSSVMTTSSSIKTTSAVPTTSTSSVISTTSKVTSTSVVMTTTSAPVTTSSVKATTTTSSAASSTTDTLVFSSLAAIVSGSDKISTTTLSSYSVSSCAALCDANSACVFYNIYYASTILSFITGSTPYCALYSSTHTAADATDSGTLTGLTYSGSSGYINASNLAKASTATSSAKATSTSAAASSSTKAASTSSAVTTSTSSANALNLVAGLTSSVLAAVTSSVALPSTSVAVKITTSSIALPSTTLPVTLSTSILAAVTSAVPTITSVAAAVTSVVPSVTVSTSSVCALPTWAYSGWCDTLPSLVPNIAANVANVASLNKGYIIPLYIYPSWWTNPGAWDWIFTAAANYPSVKFTVIINPNSGPGTSAVPNTDYQYELQKMAAVSNIIMLGYVDTAFGSRSQSAVSNDISIYAGWAAANSALAMDGIFFDNQASGTSYLSMYQSYAAQVRSSSGFLSGVVGMAPGQVCDPGFVDIADFTVVFEDTSSVLQTDIFGWYASFLNGLSASQLQKVVWMLTAADSTTTLAISNIQAALNPKYIYATDNTGAWGAAFQSAPSSAFLSKVLGLIDAPLSQVAGLVGT